MRALMTLVGFAVASLVLGSTWLEEGEVATLVTFDAKQRAIVTPVWIVDLDGHAYVRSPGPDARWLERLRVQPVVHLSRGNGLTSVRGVPQLDPAVREAVNAAMSRKYGRLDHAIAWLRSPERAIPVRLDPLPPDGTPSRQAGSADAKVGS